MASGNSNEPKQGPPCFFKVVRYPSAPHLALPVAFVRSYLGEIPKKSILETETGEHSWRVTLKKMGEDYCFVDGWAEVVKDVSLCLRDIVVFRLTDPVTFQVSFFDSQGCEKDLPSNNNGLGGGDDEVTPTTDEDLSFRKQISVKSNRFIMALPKKFVMAAGLENQRTIQVRDFNRKEWVLGLMIENYGTKTRHNLSSGWSYFRQHHDLSDGDICVFKFLKEEGVLLLTDVIKSKSQRNEETSPGFVKVKIKEESVVEEVAVKRKRGRPPREKPAAGSSSHVVEVNMEVKTDLVKKKRGRPPRVKPAGGRSHFVEVNTEVTEEFMDSETDRLSGNKQVIYF